MLDVFEETFHKVRKYLMTEGKEHKQDVAENPKGDISKVFDLKAEEIIINSLKEAHEKGRVPALHLLTEERGEVPIGENPEYNIVIDPVDGSTNYKHNQEGVGFTIAAIPANEEVSPKNVKYAFTGSVTSGDTWSAEKGKGAWYNGKKIDKPSQVKEIGKAIINIDPDFRLAYDGKHKERVHRIVPIIQDAGWIRRIGSCALELSHVASGNLDAHVDVRDALTPENFMASYLIIHEAGGIMTDGHGKDFGEMRDITKKFTVVAAGNKELHEKIIRHIKW